MDFRHEVKHEINRSDMMTIRQRLRAVAYPDVHAVNGLYHIRSLYFDNLDDKALLENINGLSRREKFRIRFYNNDTSVIHLEKKSKAGGLGSSVNIVTWILLGVSVFFLVFGLIIAFKFKR